MIPGTGSLTRRSVSLMILLGNADMEVMGGARVSWGNRGSLLIGQDLDLGGIVPKESYGGFWRF